MEESRQIETTILRSFIVKASEKTAQQLEEARDQVGGDNYRSKSLSYTFTLY